LYIWLAGPGRQIEPESPRGSPAGHEAAFGPNAGRRTRGHRTCGPEANHTEWGSYMRFRLGHIPPENPGARRSRWAGGPTGLRGWVAAGSAAFALVLTLVGVAAAGVFPGAGSGGSASGLHPARAASHGTRKSGRARTAPAGPAAPATVTSDRHGSPPRRPASTPPRPGGTATAALETSCRSVAHVGDSTSVDLISPANLPDPGQRLPARYAEVGVRHLRIDASGGRSIVEQMPGQINGYRVAQAWWNEGYRGCWVFALGTNDVANVSVGSAVGLMARVREMMSAAHGEPVMWVNTVTQLDSGPWSEANEALWDHTLIRALALYPNLRIFNWAGLAQPGWFLSDGIHYNQAGCAIRAEAIAHALARAFPRHGHSTSRIVR
jgi:hypothetical protein